jgi:hypothetical protein
VKKPLVGIRRTLFQVLLVAAGLVVLAIPPITLLVSGDVSTDALWTWLRFVALEAFTLVFIDIVIGAFRPSTVRVFKGRAVQRTHVAVALLGFALGLSHGIMAFAFGIAGYATAAVWVGPAVLVTLVAVIITALARKRFRRSWRWIHRLNYFIFAAVLVHGLTLGYDLRNEVFLKVWFAFCAAVVAVGFVCRMLTLLGRASDKLGA